MKLKKVLALLSAGLMTAAALSGCAGKTDDKDKVYQIGLIQLVQHDALDQATKGFQDALKEKLGDKVEFDLQNASGANEVCATIANQFVSAKKDLIFANATPALQAAAAATADIPIMATSITDYATALDIDNWTGTTGKNISGTADLAPLAEQAAMFKELLPDAKNIGLLYCSGEPNSKFQVDVISAELTKLGYTCKEYTFADSNDVAAVTTTACNESDALYIPTDNTAAANTEVIANIANPADIPVIASEEGICKGCGVATLSISYYSLGYITGEMAYEVLVNGADPSTMEVKYATDLTKMYVKERAEKFDITVPDGYEELAIDD